MLSILIPTYNYDVCNLVSTLFKQASEAAILFEIIVWDDASTNISIVEKNKENKSLPHYYFYQNSSNQGRTKTRNNLAESAKYNWLLFLDADVFPKHDNFIKRYMHGFSENYQLVIGGICYLENKPEDSVTLRWKYGKKRESLSVSKRNGKLYQSIISGCLFINKKVFLRLNKKMLHNDYGMDIYFQKLLKDENSKVLHIDNPVYHLGLETNDVFVKKSLQAVNTTIKLEKMGLLENQRPLQKSYTILRKWKLLGMFMFIVKPCMSSIEKNLFSKNPSIFLFDLYRLYHYLILKKSA